MQALLDVLAYTMLGVFGLGTFLLVVVGLWALLIDREGRGIVLTIAGSFAAAAVLWWAIGRVLA